MGPCLIYATLHFDSYRFFSRSRTSISVTRILDREDLAAVVDEEVTPSDSAPDDSDEAWPGTIKISTPGRCEVVDLAAFAPTPQISFL
jgi:hypothetical protein